MKKKTKMPILGISEKNENENDICLKIINNIETCKKKECNCWSYLVFDDYDLINNIILSGFNV